ncbi:hypothetical protein [Devosia sp.]
MSRQDKPTGYTTPKWVKATGVVAAIIVAILLIVVVTGIGGSHGPWRHMG